MALEAVVYSMPQEHFGYSPYRAPWCDTAGCIGSEWDPILLASLVQDVGEWEVDDSDQGASPEREAACAATARRRKRRRTKAVKDEVEMESQRMTHIAVERNRRKQMNEYLAALRSLMPPSYAQRGDQASIVGGAINYVRELEQLLQSLEVHKSRKEQSSSSTQVSPFAGFFTLPQYSTSGAGHGGGGGDNDARKIDAETTAAAGSSSRLVAVADVEASMVEAHASVKVQVPRRPRQLLRLAAGLQRQGLTTLHLNMTAADAMVMYSFSLKVEDGCKIGSAEEIATAVHEILGRIHEEAGFS